MKSPLRFFLTLLVLLLPLLEAAPQPQLLIRGAPVDSGIVRDVEYNGDEPYESMPVPSIEEDDDGNLEDALPDDDDALLPLRTSEEKVDAQRRSDPVPIPADVLMTRFLEQLRKAKSQVEAVGALSTKKNDYDDLTDEEMASLLLLILTSEEDNKDDREKVEKENKVVEDIPIPEEPDEREWLKSKSDSESEESDEEDEEDKDTVYLVSHKTTTRIIAIPVKELQNMQAIDDEDSSEEEEDQKDVADEIEPHEQRQIEDASVYAADKHLLIPTPTPSAHSLDESTVRWPDDGVPAIRRPSETQSSIIAITFNLTDLIICSAALFMFFWALNKLWKRFSPKDAPITARNMPRRESTMPLPVKECPPAYSTEALPQPAAALPDKQPLPPIAEEATEKK